MKKLIIIITLFISYNSYAQYVPKAGNKLNVKPNGILVPTSTADDTPIARLEIFNTGTSVLKPSTLPTASASVLGVVRVGTGLAIDGSGILSATGGGGSYVDLTTAQNVGGVKTFTADNLYISGSTGTQKMFGFSGADTNPNFKGVYDFDGGYSGFQSGTNKGVQVFGYWGVTIQGNTQQATPNTLATITGATTDNSLTVLQTTANAPIMEIKAASGTSANYLNISTSAGTGNIFNINSAGNATLAGSLNGITLTNSGTKTLNLASGSSLITTGAFSTTLTSTATTVATLPAGTSTLYGTGTGTITSAQLLASLTNETGTGNAVFSISPTFTGTPLTSAPTATTVNTQIATTAFAGARLVLTGSGTGAATTINVPHGLTGITTTSPVFAQARNAAAAGIVSVTADATNVIIVYSVAPASGTGNLSYNIEIKP